jgi:hypothetical protein
MWGAPCFGTISVRKEACVGEEIIFWRMHSKAVSMRYHQRFCCEFDQSGHPVLAPKTLEDDDDVDFRSVIFFMVGFDIR